MKYTLISEGSSIIHADVSSGMNYGSYYTSID